MNYFDNTEILCSRTESTSNEEMQKPQLVIHVEGIGEDILFSKTKVIAGRYNRCDITFDNESVSRIHAIFLFEENKWYIQDNKSTNGTWLNNRKLCSGGKCQISKGDVICLAKKEAMIITAASEATYNSTGDGLFCQKSDALYFNVLDISTDNKQHERRRKMKSIVSQVTVYQSGAMIKRMASVHLKAGVTKVIFDDIPVNPNEMSRESVQIYLENSVTCNQISFREGKNVGDASEIKYEYTQEQMSQLLECNKRMLEIDSLIKLNCQEIKTLSEHAYPTIREDNVPVAYISAYLDYHYKKQKELEGENLSLKEEHDRLVKEVDEIKDAAKITECASGEIILELCTDKERDSTVDISYYDYRVKWYPFYNIIANTSVDKNPLSFDHAVQTERDYYQKGLLFSLEAKVIQTTGEDWEKVHVTVSTGNLLKSNTRPTLLTWFVEDDKTKPVRPPYAAQAIPVIATGETSVLGSETLLQPAVNRERTCPNPSKVVQDQGVVTEFQLDGIYSIPKGEDGSMLKIKETFLPAEYRYFIIPKAECSAFLTAEIKEWRHANLLGCDANLYLDHCYVGTTHINPNGVEDSLYISLGRDKEISVERLKLKNNISKNLLGNRILREFKYLLRIKNNKTETIYAIVEDQVPVSRNDKIKVEIQNISDAALNSENGKLEWNRSVEAGDQMELHVDFQVTYPADIRVNM